MLSIKVPPLGESITEATVSRWLKAEGDPVAAGETLVELETDKITVEVPALKAGVLATRAKNEGDAVAVNDVLGELDEAVVGAPVALVAPPRVPAPPRPVAAAPAAASAVAPATAPAAVRAAAPAAPSAVVRSAPSARRLADESGIDIADVSGTGRGGAVSKPDVMAAMRAAAVPTAGALSRETREKMSTRRKRIAENLLQAQHATAHLTTFNEIDMSAISALRERMKAKVEKEHGLKLSFMPFFAKACVMALKAFPVVNAQIDGDSIIYRHYVHLGIAVASEAGLVVPNVKDADQLGILSLTREIAALAQRARDGKLTMDDLTGGTFTVSNGGVFGSLLSTPILNYPQSGILGLHKIQDRPVAVDGRVEIRPMMYLALSYDHRIIDGQQAVLFVVRLKELLEDPAAMLIE
jgi:2-oxoglutarate dehydrogenase E2 component (dihydrolipoamide succinyltransferase)